MERENNGEVTESGFKEPSFEGRLQLKNFMFSGASSSSSSSTPVSAPVASGMRRSSRLLMTSHPPSPSSAPAAQDPPSQSRTTSKPAAAAPPPRKRKSPSSATSASASASASPPKRRAPRPTRYAPPSTYAHLPLLPDAIGPDLLILFVGLNPGVETARTGHAYAHPSNLFWRLLHAAGMTPGAGAYRAADDRRLPALRGGRLGLTNIVARPTRSGAELRPAELDAGVAALEEKCRRWRPECVCVVGKGIWESLVRVWGRREGKGKGKGRREFAYGWQSERMGAVAVDAAGVGGSGEGEGRGDNGEKGGTTTTTTTPWEGARIFVATSTSGLAASLRPEEKERIWKVLGDWCVQRRREREEKEEEKIQGRGESG